MKKDGEKKITERRAHTHKCLRIQWTLSCKTRSAKAQDKVKKKKTSISKDFRTLPTKNWNPFGKSLEIIQSFTTRSEYSGKKNLFIFHPFKSIKLFKKRTKILMFEQEDPKTLVPFPVPHCCLHHHHHHRVAVDPHGL